MTEKEFVFWNLVIVAPIVLLWVTGVVLFYFKEEKDKRVFVWIPIFFVLICLTWPVFLIIILISGGATGTAFKEGRDGWAWLLGQVDTDYIAVFLPVAAVLGLFLI